MKKWSLLFITLAACLSITWLCGCHSNSDNSTTLSAQESMRNEVIEKWEKEADVLGTGKFIEDAYKDFPDDETIANIYFYSTAKYEYELYCKYPDDQDFLDSAIEFAAKIDPDYNGAFSDDMHEFVNQLIPQNEIEEQHAVASSQEDKYNSLTTKEKKEICEYIEERYAYYDSINGGYAGDKYSDTIMEEAAEKYGLSVDQIDIIWMYGYSY